MKKVLLSLVALVAVAISANAKIVPSYTAAATVGEYDYWASTNWMSATPFSTTDAKVEMYKDSIVVRSWAGVEGYDIALTLDESGNASKLYQIVNGEATFGGTLGGYQYANTGLTGDGAVAAVAAYTGTGYIYAWADQTSGGGITFMCYTYGDEACQEYIGCTYYYVSWDVPAPKYTVDATVGAYDYWASTSWMSATPFSSSTAKAEVYADSVVIRSWAGVEGNDIAVAWDADGNATKLYQIENEVVSFDGTVGGYQYANTGLTGDDDIAAVAAYLGSGYCYVWEDETTGGLTFMCYTYGDVSCNEYVGCTYYYVGWNVPDATGIKTVAKTTEASTSDVVYNLAGQRVSPNTKGLVIKNGKKMFVK